MPPPPLLPQSLTGTFTSSSQPPSAKTSSFALSNLRASVHFRQQSVYAGEPIECIITFRNIGAASAPGNPPATPSTSEPQRPSAAGGENAAKQHSRRSSLAQAQAQARAQRSGSFSFPRAPSISGVSSTAGAASTRTTAAATAPAKGGRGHRPSLSLNVVSASLPRSGGVQSAVTAASAVAGVRGHGRSLSIISLGSDVGSNEGRTKRVPGPGKHGRSASLQVLHQYPGGGSGLGVSPRQSSPLVESTTNTPPPPGVADEEQPLPIRPARRRPGTQSADTTPQLGRQGSLRKGASVTVAPPPNPNFQFTGTGSTPSGGLASPSTERPKNMRAPSSFHSRQQRSVSPRPPDGWVGQPNTLNPISRVMSETSTAGTPRSSSEFYSMSNHSDETLTSEAPSQYYPTSRWGGKASHSHHASRSRNVSPQKPGEPETLMMGYVQTMGYFTLDGGLVNGAPFEEVKRKGVQGGGGVVGVERSKRSSGMFGAFSWGNLGESLGGLLGSDDMSSMAQMKAAAGSKSIPLLSTPQSLLFVDLRLAPGESRSYSYRFALPRGLPPSHRGRAIKVSYHLSLGVQRPEGQAVKHVDVPFRVLGSYNSRGETLGHDLMAPYVLLQDSAQSHSITLHDATLVRTPAALAQETWKNKDAAAQRPKQGLEDFLRYTERLLEPRKGSSSGALVSPSEATSSRKHSFADQLPTTTKEAIDLAIIRANYSAGGSSSTTSRRPDSAPQPQQSGNRFNIARAGHPVGVLTLLRPAYRLGETVIGTIDFTIPSSSSQQLPTFAITAELESAEHIDPSLALRSASSIHRVTRRVHATTRSNALFARRLSFSLPIPASATPTFETTGVSFAWRVRVEFTTLRVPSGSTTGEMERFELLEDLGADERGKVLLARERLPAETWEIGVPLRVLGVGGGGAGGEGDGGIGIWGGIGNGSAGGEVVI